MNAAKTISIDYPDNFDDIDPKIIEKVINQYLKNNLDIIHGACMYILNKQDCYTCKYGKDRFSPDSVLYCENDKTAWNIVPCPKLLHGCWVAGDNFR